MTGDLYLTVWAWQAMILAGIIFVRLLLVVGFICMSYIKDKKYVHPRFLFPDLDEDGNEDRGFLIFINVGSSILVWAILSSIASIWMIVYPCLIVYGAVWTFRQIYRVEIGLLGRMVRVVLGRSCNLKVVVRNGQ